MKKKLISLPLLLLLFGCNNSSTNNEQIIDNARIEVINLNKKYNRRYQLVYLEYFKWNKAYESAAICLQELLTEIIAVNKSLKIDCKQYNANGEPSMVEDADGSRSPIEGLPDELRIDK